MACTSTSRTTWIWVWHWRRRSREFFDPPTDPIRARRPLSVADGAGRQIQLHGGPVTGGGGHQQLASHAGNPVVEEPPTLVALGAPIDTAGVQADAVVADDQPDDGICSGPRAGNRGKPDQDLSCGCVPRVAEGLAH